MTAKPEAAADATSTAHSTPAGVSHTLDSELTSAGYGRQFEVVQEELAAHLITASAVMRRGLPAPMMIVCASVIFILTIVCVGEINIPDPQIRQVQMHQVASKENNISDLDVGEFTGTLTVGYVNDKENNISDPDVGKFTGALTVGMMTNAGNPLGNTASGSDQEHTRWSIHAATRAYMLEHTCGNWSIHAGAYMRQLAPIVSTLTWFAKARTGKLKSIPQSILGEQRKPGSIAETSMMQRFQAVHIEASDAMFSIYMRKFDPPLRQTMWPHKFNGTDEAHQTGQSVKGDIVTSISILMDSMEKYGWDERNLKREFFAHGAIQLGSERSLKRGLSLLKSSMVESLRIGVELD
jgi:hypothetical protein